MSEYSYFIGRSFAVASTNCDTSGLSQEDIDQLKEFESFLVASHGHGHFTVTKWETEFRICDIVNLMSDCVIIDIKDKE